MIISAYSFPSMISSLVYNPVGVMPQIAPLAIGIALIWVAWTGRLKWALMIWGAVMTIMSLVALVPALILLILYWSTSK
jgi:energy-converting hydrogenase Eha subunit E